MFVSRRIFQAAEKAAETSLAANTEYKSYGLFWKVTCKVAPRYMWSSRPEKVDIAHTQRSGKHQFLANQPEWLDDADDLPDDINPLKVKPHLEYRTASVGVNYAFGENPYDFYWEPLKKLRQYNIELLKEEDDIIWDRYVERNGFSPNDYMHSETYQNRYNGKCDEEKAY